MRYRYVVCMSILVAVLVLSGCSASRTPSDNRSITASPMQGSSVPTTPTPTLAQPANIQLQPTDVAVPALAPVQNDPCNPGDKPLGQVPPVDNVEITPDVPVPTSLVEGSDSSVSTGVVGPGVSGTPDPNVTIEIPNLATREAMLEKVNRSGPTAPIDPNITVEPPQPGTETNPGEPQPLPASGVVEADTPVEIDVSKLPSAEPPDPNATAVAVPNGFLQPPPCPTTIAP